MSLQGEDDADRARLCRADDRATGKLGRQYQHLEQAAILAEGFEFEILRPGGGAAWELKRVKHELTITHDKLIGVRPFLIECSCGFKGCGETYAESERIVQAHQRLEEQKETLKARGFLK